MWLKGELVQQAGICQSDAEDSGGKGPWEQIWEVRVERGSFQWHLMGQGQAVSDARIPYPAWFHRPWIRLGLAGPFRGISLWVRMGLKASLASGFAL